MLSPLYNISTGCISIVIVFKRGNDEMIRTKYSSKMIKLADGWNTRSLKFKIYEAKSRIIYLARKTDLLEINNIKSINKEFLIVWKK